jgi:hypothetical protein
MLIGNEAFAKVSHWGEMDKKIFSTNSAGEHYTNKVMKTSSWLTSHSKSHLTLNLQHIKKKT